MNNKLAIGTANFGINYGINNSKGKMSDDEILKIFLIAESSGINIFDTAQAYGNSEERIGYALKKINSNFDIVTKLKPLFQEDVSNFIEDSLTKLGIKSLYGVLFHNFKDFHKNKEYYTQLTLLKDQGKIGKIGFSVYYPSEIEYLFGNNFGFDIVQIPYSVFDNRFEYLLPKLKKHNIEIHSRSTFLQGLVFMKPESLPYYLKGAKKQIAQLIDISKKYHISIASLCLNFVMSNPLIDKVVIGIDSVRQLKQNHKNLKDKFVVLEIVDQLKSLKIEDEKIILPFNWK
jgi:aryl-alcohol dehydrogenase-like predicted oxidoreductase